MTKKNKQRGHEEAAKPMSCRFPVTGQAGQLAYHAPLRSLGLRTRYAAITCPQVLVRVRYDGYRNQDRKGSEEKVERAARRGDAVMRGLLSNWRCRQAHFRD